MENDFKPVECNDNDVLDFGNNTYKISKFRKAVANLSNSTLVFKLNQELSGQGVIVKCSPDVTWFLDGIDCEILILGSKSWKKGKVKFKVSVDFYAEEEETIQIVSNYQSKISGSESPLDDLRRMIQEEN